MSDAAKGVLAALLGVLLIGFLVWLDAREEESELETSYFIDDPGFVFHEPEPPHCVTVTICAENP